MELFFFQDLIILKPNFELYTSVAAQIREVFAIYDPNFVSHSLDEATLNVTSYCKTHGLSGKDVAELIKNEVLKRTECSASIGIACNSRLAKICSNVNKPNGLVILCVFFLPVVF